MAHLLREIPKYAVEEYLSIDIDPPVTPGSFPKPINLLESRYAEGPLVTSQKSNDWKHGKYNNPSKPALEE